MTSRQPPISVANGRQPRRHRFGQGQAKRFIGGQMQQQVQTRQQGGNAAAWPGQNHPLRPACPGGAGFQIGLCARLPLAAQKDAPDIGVPQRGDGFQARRLSFGI